MDIRWKVIASGSLDLILTFPKSTHSLYRWGCTVFINTKISESIYIPTSLIFHLRLANVLIDWTFPMFFSAKAAIYIRTALYLLLSFIVSIIFICIPHPTFPSHSCLESVSRDRLIISRHPEREVLKSISSRSTDFSHSSIHF